MRCGEQDVARRTVTERCRCGGAPGEAPRRGCGGGVSCRQQAATLTCRLGGLEGALLCIDADKLTHCRDVSSGEPGTEWLPAAASKRLVAPPGTRRRMVTEPLAAKQRSGGMRRLAELLNPTGAEGAMLSRGCSRGESIGEARGSQDGCLTQLSVLRVWITGDRSGAAAIRGPPSWMLCAAPPATARPVNLGEACGDIEIMEAKSFEDTAELTVEQPAAAHRTSSNCCGPCMRAMATSSDGTASDPPHGRPPPFAVPSVAFIASGTVWRGAHADRTSCLGERQACCGSGATSWGAQTAMAAPAAGHGEGAHDGGGLLPRRTGS